MPRLYLQGGDVRNVSSCHLSILCRDRGFSPQQATHAFTILYRFLVTLGDLDLCLGVCLSSLYAGYLLQDLVVRVYTRPTEPATSRHLSTLAKNLSHLIHLRKSICLVPSNVLIFCTMQMTIY
jgi:hypothetical protein